MTEHAYSCRHCYNVFKLNVSGLTSGKAINCPKCGNADVETLTSWAPIGFDISEDRNMWEYECQQCKIAFKLPIPSSPTQEKEIQCPECSGRHIHRLTRIGGEPLYCG